MYRLGVNIASDRISAAVIDDDYYRIIGRSKTEKKEKRNAEELCDDIVFAVNTALEDANTDKDYILSIGIAAPGNIDKETGVIQHASNFGFDKIPLRDMLLKHFDKPIYFENDANCLALGEYLAGVGSRGDSLMAVTINKGVGGGIIIDGKILGGCNGAAGEIGHMVINVDGEPCTCGRRGCFETYASMRALTAKIKDALLEDKSCEIWEMINGDINTLNEKIIFEAIALEIPLAKKVFEEYVYYVSVGIN